MAIFFLYAKHCLWLLAVWQTLPFFLCAWSLRSDWDDRCVNKWKITCRNLHKRAWFADKNVFCHPIGFHFYLAIISIPQFSFSDIPASKAFNHRRKTPILLNQADLFQHRSFMWSSCLHMPTKSHSFAASQPHSWPFDKHDHCDTYTDGLLNGLTGHRPKESK